MTKRLAPCTLAGLAVGGGLIFRTKIPVQRMDLGQDLFVNQAAVIEVKLGHSRSVLLGLRAQYRRQSHGTFKLLFNSLFLGVLR